jgi:predicted DNA-binding transcriptional regulator AlpA
MKKFKSMFKQSPANDPFLVHLKYSELRDLLAEVINYKLDTYLLDKNSKSNIEFLTRKEIAKYVKKTPQTISDWVNFEGFPKPINKIGRENLWLKSEVDSFLINRK